MTLPRLDLATDTMRERAQRHVQAESDHSGFVAHVPTDQFERLGAEFSMCRGCRVVLLSARPRLRRKQLARLRQIVGSKNITILEPQ